MKRVIAAVGLVAFMMGSVSIVMAQKAKFQSMFIYNFTKYIKWPDAYNPGGFVIAVVGDDAVYNNLMAVASSKKEVNGMNLVVKKFSSVDDITDCQVLFVAANFCDQLGQVNSKIQGKPVLVITDKPGMAQSGSVINFVEKDGKMKFELNQSRADSRGLKVSGSLTSLAILI